MQLKQIKFLGLFLFAILFGFILFLFFEASHKRHYLCHIQDDEKRIFSLTLAQNSIQINSSELFSPFSLVLCSSSGAVLTYDQTTQHCKNNDVRHVSFDTTTQILVFPSDDHRVRTDILECAPKP